MGVLMLLAGHETTANMIALSARDPRGHVAFGFGPHVCLGQPLARMEPQVVYSTLYRRVPTLATT